MSDVKLRHPEADTNHQIKVNETARETYESQGWVEVGTSTEADKAAKK